MIGTAVPSRAAKCLPAFFLAAFLLRLASQAAVVDGLVSYWPLDVSNGGITPDLSFSNQMIINGGATVVAGQFSNAFSFNGSSQYLINYHSTNNANSGLPIWRAGTYTVAMWVKGAAQANKYLFSEGNTNTTLPIFVIQTGLSDGSKLDVILRNNTGQNLISHVTSSGVVFDNTWHHIAWVDNLGSVKLYIDGTLDPASAALNFDYNRIEGTVTLNDTVIGCLVRTGVSTANIFNGLIDEVTVWERLLSPDEVNQVRTNGVYLSGQLISARPAIITSLPADAEAHVSDTQVFSVGASGNRPLTYQWLLDGTNLADNARITGSQSNVLSIANIASNDAGAYTVTVSNAFGSTNSPPATLTITPVPTNGVYWISSVGGNWNNPANWSTGSTPGPNDDVFVTRGGRYIVSLNVDASVRSLTFGAISGQQTLTIAGTTLTLNEASTFNSNTVVKLNGGTLAGAGEVTVNGPLIWGSSGALQGPGILNVNGSLTINPGAGSAAACYGRTVNLSGTTSWIGPGVMYFASGAVINNLAGATFTVSCDSDASNYGGGAQSVLNNAGTFRKSSGSGLTGWGIGLNNNSMVEVQSGTLRLSGGGASSAGVFSVSSGTTLSFSGTHSLTNNTSLSGAGSVVFGGATAEFQGSYGVSNATQIVGGTVTFLAGSTLNSVGTNLAVNGTVVFQTGNPVALAGLDVTGGTLTGGDSVTVNGPMSWGGSGFLLGSGILNLNGSLTINPGAGSAAACYGRTVNLSGATTWIGPGVVYFGSGAVINNLAGATFTVSCDSDASNYGGGAQSVLNNAGTFRKNSGSGLTGWGVGFNNNGTVEVQSGTLRLSGGGGGSGGVFTVSPATTLNFGGTHSLANGTSLSGAGAVVFGGATAGFQGSYGVSNSTQIVGGTVTFLPGSTLNSAGTNLTVNGTVVFQTGNPVTLSGLDVTGGTLTGGDSVTVNGPMSWGGSGFLLGPGILNVNGSLTINPGAGSAAACYGRTVNLSGTTSWIGPGVMYFGSGAVVNNLAAATFTVSCDSDASNYGGGAQSVLNNAGIFRKSSGSGLTGWGIGLNNNGTLEVQKGTLNLSQDFSLGPSSTLSFLIGGTSPGTNYGKLLIGHAVHLSGSLNAEQSNGFTPNVGETFRIITWPSQSGGFSQENGLDLGNGLYWQAICDDSGLSLVTKTSIVPGPPPATNLVDQVVAFGDTAFFGISPNGTEPFTYQWKFSGTNLLDQTNSTLVIPGVQNSSAGSYCVVVVDGFFITNTYCATLSALTPPSITGQPASQTIAPSNNVTFMVTALGSGPLRYQWRLNGENILGATNSTYTITNAQPRDGGAYNVLVANRARAVSSAIAILKVTSPALPFVDNFASRVNTNSFSGLGSGSNISATREPGEPLHSNKFGSNSVWLQWTAPASGVATFNTRGSAFDTLLGVYSGTALTNLTTVASDDDRGFFFTSEAVFNATNGAAYNIAIDGLASARGDIVLTWNLDTNITQLPRIIQQPADVTTTIGGDANFSVHAASTTNISYQWYFNCCLAIPGATNSSLTISNITPLNAGTYRVEVTAAGQTIRSQDALLEIGPANQVHSFDKLQDLLAAEGAFGLLGAHRFDLGFPSVTLGSLGSQLINNFNSTTDQGEPIHSSTIGGSSRWYELNAAATATMVVDTVGSDIDTVLGIYTGNDIFSLKLIASDNNGAPDGIRSKLSFPATNGVRYLVAVDGVNGAQGNINLNWRMGTPPVAASTFTNIAVSEGNTLLLSTGSTNGFPPPTYQWRLNGINIAGATASSYSVGSLKYTNNGVYTVVVSNLVGLVTNSVATVNLQVPLRLDLDASSGSAKFRIAATATQAVTIQISTNLRNWTNIFTNANPNAALNYLDNLAPSRSTAFYRLVRWP